MSLFVLDTDIVTLFQRNHAAVLARIAEAAARMLGIGERTLYRKIKKWGIKTGRE